MWCIPVSGEAREVLSWSQGLVRTLCILPNPELGLPLRQDSYKHKRPLVAMVDNAGPGPQFCAVSFISIREGDQVCYWFYTTDKNFEWEIININLV